MRSGTVSNWSLWFACKWISASVSVMATAHTKTHINRKSIIWIAWCYERELAILSIFIWQQTKKKLSSCMHANKFEILLSHRSHKTGQMWNSGTFTLPNRPIQMWAHLLNVENTQSEFWIASTIMCMKNELVSSCWTCEQRVPEIYLAWCGFSHWVWIASHLIVDEILTADSSPAFNHPENVRKECR